jgi:phage baseplate assembly protein W
MSAADRFIGVGWSFPPTFDRVNAEVVMTEGIEDIERSLEIIFSTALGERIMNPAFGCNLDEMVFEAMNAGKLAYIENVLRTAILYHEPRINAETVALTPEQAEGILWIQIDYTVRTTNSRFNFVYPFYLITPSG